MPINLPTYEQTAELLSKVLGIDVDTDTLITLLGTQTSAASNATSGNAHAKLNWLLSTLATVNTNTATANLGSPSSTASNSPSAVAHAKLNYLLANMPTGMVKSVQNGLIRGSAGSNTVTIQISQVNPSKTFVILNGSGTSSSNTYDYVPILNSIFSNSFVVQTTRPDATSGFSSQTHISWQLIEFY